ncbi:hypothetical protein [Streptomyces sp. CC228A]|nr:hypothetical protein [Streptomyces sp. CC228A]
MPHRTPGRDGEPARDVELNPLFSREPVRVPRHALPADGMDPEAAYQLPP